jgi:hypothetical protein
MPDGEDVAMQAFDQALLLSSEDPIHEEWLIDRGKRLAEALKPSLGELYPQELRRAIGFNRLGYSIEDIAWELETTRIVAGKH